MRYNNIQRVSFLALFIFVLAGCWGTAEERKRKYFNRGIKLYDQGDYTRATLEFKNAIQIDPEFARGRYMLGMAYMKQKDFRKAYGSFKKAIDLAPDLFEAQTAMGRILLMAKKLQPALNQANLVLKKRPNYYEALMLKASCLIIQKKDKQASDILVALIKSNPDKSAAYLVFAQVKIRQKNIQAAIETLKQLLAIDKNNRPAILMLASCYESEKKIALAEDLYIRLVSLSPDNADLLLARFYTRQKRLKDAEKILRTLTEKKPEKTGPLLELAAFYNAVGKEDQALGTLLKATKDLPDEYRLYSELAGLYLAKKKVEKATRIYQDAIDHFRTGPDFLKAQLALARIQYINQDFETALKLANEVLKEDPNNLGGHTLKGDILMRRADFLGAVSAYRTVSNSTPENMIILYKLASAHLNNKEPNLALEIYKKILTADPKQKRARMGLIKIYQQKGNLADIAKEYKAILATSPDDRDALLGLGDIALINKKTNNAEKHYSRLLQLESNSELANYKYGLVKQARKKYREAKALFEKALKINPDFSPALARLLDIMNKKRDIALALDRCLRQVQLRPENSKYRLFLAQLYVQQKDLLAAEKQLATAIELDPNNIPALFMMVWIEETFGSVNASIVKYQALKKKDPNDIKTLLILAALFEKKGEYDQTKELYKKVLALNPKVDLAANNLAFYYAEFEPDSENIAEAKRLSEPLALRYKKNPSFTDTVSWVNYRLGDFSKARDLILTIPKEKRNTGVINYHLGMIYLKLNEQAKAQFYLQRALSVKEDFPGKAAGVRALKNIEKT
jgi:tetratricopeptide (TPR) repeat protein